MWQYDNDNVFEKTMSFYGVTNYTIIFILAVQRIQILTF